MSQSFIGSFLSPFQSREFWGWEIATWSRLRRSHTESADEVGIDLPCPVVYPLE